MIRHGIIIILGLLIIGCSVREEESHWPTGEVMGRGPMQMGKKNGEWTIYTRAGHLRARGRYERDREVGVWSWFRNDGTIERTEEFDHSTQNLADGRRWTTRYKEDGQTIRSIGDTKYIMGFTRKGDNDTWSVFDQGIDLNGVVTGTVVPDPEKKGYIFTANDGESVALSGDPRQWAERIRTLIKPVNLFPAD